MICFTTDGVFHTRGLPGASTKSVSFLTISRLSSPVIDLYVGTREFR
jgi:hypothetical protein